MQKSKEILKDINANKYYQYFKKDLLESINYLSQDEINLLLNTCEFAFKAHDGQFRISGDPYIVHPMAVAKELSKWEVDIETLQAGLLHDVLEDTGKTKDQLKNEFGVNIAEIVDGLSKLEKIDSNNYREHQAENFKKMILAMVRDLRVLVIKLADRLHNMRTLESLRADKRIRVAKETMEVYVLLANRIGMEIVCSELQDLSFKYLRPVRYKVLKKEVNKFQSTRQIIIDKINKKFLQQLFLFNIEAKIKTKQSNIYNIYLNLSSKKHKFAEIMNMYSFTIIVNSIQDCYRALGAIHSLYNPKPGMFEDYIAVPKKNAHQGLKTVLINNIGHNIEVNLLTKDMYKISNFGMVVNWLNNKSFNYKQDVLQISKKELFRNLMEIKSNSDSAIDFFESVKKDLSHNDIYVFTPRGRIIILPNGATPIDFAYAIHTDIGHNCIGAKVDNILVPLRYKLSSGQKVEILTRNNGSPNPDWISFIVSARAKNAIHSKIKDISRQDAIVLGESLLRRVFDSLLPKGLVLSEDVKADYLFSLYDNKTFDEVLYDIGTGRLLPVSVAMKIFKLAGKNFGSDCLKLKPIILSGDNKTNIDLACCCNPIPGDKVKALVIRNQGFVIHREDCSNILLADPNSIFDADLASSVGDLDRFYNVKLKIDSKDHKGLFFHIVSCVTLHSANIVKFETLSDKRSGFDGFIEFLFEIQIKGGLNKLNKIIKLIELIPQVNKVCRL